MKLNVGYDYRNLASACSDRGNSSALEVASEYQREILLILGKRRSIGIFAALIHTVAIYADCFFCI